MQARPPSFPQRLSAAWSLLRGQPPRDRRPIQQVKASPLAWPAWRDGKPTWQMIDLEGYVREGFNLNSLIYSAIMYKARAATAAPLRAYTGNLDHPKLAPPTHELSRLLARPNPYQSGPEFAALNEVYWNLTGNVFVHFDRPRRHAFPLAMRTLRPDRVYIIPERGGLKGYLYVPEGKGITDGVPILPEDMSHIKLPNPGDPLEGLGYGLAPLSPVAQSGDVDNQITGFLKLFFESGTMLSTVLEFDAELDEDTVARIRARWKAIYGGADNWSEIGVIDQGGKVKRLGMTFQEMGFEGLDSRNEARILGPFGVPPILIGTRYGLERGTNSNYDQARKQFWEDTFKPELSWKEVEFQLYLTTADGAFPAYDFSEVPALQQDIAQAADAAHKLWSMGVPANTALDAVGLSIGRIPGGETGYLPLTVVPVAADGTPRLPAPSGEQDGEGEDGAGGSNVREQGQPEGEDEPAGAEVGKAGRPFVNGKRPVTA